ncbi:RHS repeat-associated core domain-containing protein [Pseudomonas lijiangensis]|uniref:RHS repeat protein n=3 Tax=Pseudomonas lijiangensis TaxID=2995658 RepID=A0ABX8HV35_9PSED|nr:RHS repeat-associated core domain-containing protein [Pseudomonas lijiangensis]QWU84098.1 RHS repeat protein [Pseudomonas lijiangensis]
MDWQFANLHRYTPTLAIVDPRRLVVRSVAWYRKQASDAPVVRIHRSIFDPAGRPIGSHDPRLWEGDAPANLVNIHSLSAQVLACESVDAGWRVSLPGEHRESVQTWDGRGTVRRLEHDGLLRPTGVFENDQCIERLTYGEVDSAPRNQCGQLIRHDDPVGTCLNTECALTGAVIEQTQHFLKDLTQLDWPESEAERDALLETGSGSTTSWAYNPLGEVIGQTDSQGNVQRFAQTVAGELQSCHLQLNGQPEQMLVSDIRYDAQGRVESETAGNGVITTARYGGEDGRLRELKAARNAGESLQDLIYDYDPVGNVISIEDRAQPIRYFANQRIEPVSTYQYDTLYQLTEATGRELAPANHGPVFADFQSPPDPTQLANYTQTYDYDAGGNLQQLTHVGSQNHSRALVTARHSNRSLPVVNNQPPSEEEIAAAFDANGNLLALQAGQALSWDLRNQLQEVRPVVRESGLDDSERYIYDASGQRLRKVRTTQAKAVTHLAEVRYLPGLEIRTDTATGETLQVITAQAGRNGVRVLHWQAGKPAELNNDQYRYSLNDHLGSSTLELDAQAQIISQESYYPFGGTSWWAGRTAIEANYKTVRYSGKERDATGLYYYGQRYYAPWLQRWNNPDPAGAVDGLNLFCFVRNNPCSGFDHDGRGYKGINDEIEKGTEQDRAIIYRGLKEMKKAGEKGLVADIDLAIEKSLFLMKREVNRLKKNDVSSLFKFIGMPLPENLSDSKGYIGHVISGYEKLIKAMSRYQKGGDLREQFVFVKDVENEQRLAHVGKDDPHKRIFFTGNFRVQNPVSKIGVLIHEISHLELQTNDDFYYEKAWSFVSMKPDTATNALGNTIKNAIEKNVRLREEYKPKGPGAPSFRAWLTTVADFWSVYTMSQITPEESAKFHSLSKDRFVQVRSRSSDRPPRREVLWQ